VQAIATQPANTPVQFEARLAQLDLARLAETAKVPALLQHKAHGVIDARIVATERSLRAGDHLGRRARRRDRQGTANGCARGLAVEKAWRRSTHP